VKTDLNVRLSDEQLVIVRFCAVECELQRSGERSVFNMMQAWTYAQGRCHEHPTEDDIVAIGALVEPTKNMGGYRKTGVRVGSDVKPSWQLVPAEMTDLVEATTTLGPDEWFFAFETIHPFVDGNGRSGATLYNWLAGTLNAPTWPPNFWNDQRRRPGDGA